jgi:methionine synthase II (cobalamin-independent)
MTPDRVHLVGSVALDSVDEVFRSAGTLLGRRLRRIPDGEPGGRRMWISWQYPFLRGQPFLRPDTSVPNPRGLQPLMLAEDADAAEIRFGELGYAREARISYQDFLAARQAGHLPADVRFQVSLPTPLAVVLPFISAKNVLRVEGPYEEAMLREVETIARAIPHRDLCIQWDVCIEMLLWDGRWEMVRNPFGEALQQEIMKRMKRLAAAVPADVELGFHLCYGDYDARHFIEPLDAGKVVEMANALATMVPRPISYIHMPVPIDRADEGYFQPLANLRLSPGTELFLGVVHPDGVEATNRRIATASKYVPDFGIATECGIARLRTPAQVRTLLEIHAGASREPAARALSTS